MEKDSILYGILAIIYFNNSNKINLILSKGFYLTFIFFVKFLTQIIHILDKYNFYPVFLNLKDKNSIFMEIDNYELTNSSEEENININTTQLKYEDKYLKEIRKLDKNFNFDENELKLIEETSQNLYNKSLESYKDIVEKNITILCEIEVKLTKYERSFNEENEENEENENINDINSDNEEDINEEEDTFLDKEEKIKLLLEKKTNLTNEIRDINKILENENYMQELLKESHDKAINLIINKRLEKLNNCYIFESTPQGNVLMIYDIQRSSFKYYSDNTIPYRYLESVARKYVMQFSCRPIYVDMEEELNLAEEKWEKEREQKEQKEQEKEASLKTQKPIEEKKSVFAKFKSYNKDGISGKVNTGVPPKNSIPMTKEQEKEKILLKEKANRYTYEGKLANFNFLKKIDRTVVDKKYAITFADFKKIQTKTLI